MNYNIKFEKETLKDFKDTIDYYDDISIQLADKFHNEFWNKIDYIKENPLYFQIGYRDRYKNSTFKNLSIWRSFYY